MTDWIPIDKRRPDPDEDGTTVLLTRETAAGERIVVEDSIYWDRDKLLRFGSGNSWRGVVAWMPYPQPYGEGKKIQKEDPKWGYNTLCRYHVLTRDGGKTTHGCDVGYPVEHCSTACPYATNGGAGRSKTYVRIIRRRKDT